MRFWKHGTRVRRSRPVQGLSMERLEARALLTVAQAAIPISSVPTTPALTAANAAEYFPLAAHAAGNNATSGTARAALLPTAVASSSPAGTAAAASQLAVSTAWTGYWLVHSTQVANVGLKYVKTAVSHDARKLGASALSALAKGNLTALGQLGNSSEVQSLSQKFSQLGSSQPVSEVGAKFTALGRSVTDQWDKMFG
jgi:hypothetical protein